MFTALVFVCLLSYVSGREIEKNDAQGSTVGEYDSDNRVSINKVVLEYSRDLLREVMMSKKPESEFDGFDGEEKIFCLESVRIKYSTCKEICRSKSFMNFLMCKSVMMTRYLTGCLSGNIQCFDETEVTTPMPETTTQGPEITSTSPPNPSGSCGISPDGDLRVTGGTEVTNNNRYPWQVGLSLTGGSSRNYICSGSVITKKHILTAASCFNNQEIYIVGFGSADESSPRFERTQNQVFIHENYNRQTFENNIAIIQFSNTIDLERNAISPICLPGNANDNLRVTAIVSGWGDIDDLNPPTDVTQLHEASVQVDKCPEQNKYTDNMICTTVGTPARDACKGDGGGPLIISTDSKHQQIGIISFGNGCGTSGSTGVYVNVGKYINWINTKVSPERTFS